MRNFYIFVISALFSSTVLAVTGNGTGSSVQVTGGGTGSSVQVTGGGTGSSVQVTGGGTGSSTQVTGNGTGSSTQVTGNGTGSSTQVTGGGTGAPQAVIEMDACMTGSYYDPENSGQGINVEVLEDQIVVYFYGREDYWLIFQGDENGLDMYQSYSGGISKVGSGYFIVVDDNNVEFGFDMGIDLRDLSIHRPIPWCLRTDCEQSFNYTRLTQPIPCATSETEVTGNGTGSSTQVTGNGTGSSTQITGGGTGSSTKITGGGTGSSVQVTGGGTGRE